MSKQTLEVPINKVTPDPDQPRKHFDVTKLATLKKSIQQHGIVSPILVEGSDSGYIIVDGERRFRAAVDLKLKTIPVTVLESTTSSNRKIEQFHIQEMHEGWTPLEKANAIAELAEELNKPFVEVCETLGINARIARQYVSLTKIQAKMEFNTNNLSMNFAEPLVSLTSYVKQLKNNELEETFTQPEQKKLEKKIVSNLADGTFTSVRDITKLKDIFRNSPKMIEQFMDGADAETLWIKSKARSAYYLRNAKIAASYTGTHIKSFMEHPDTKLTEQDATAFKYARKMINEVLAIAGKD